MYMQFEWDEKKRKANLVKHGLDFADVWEVFTDPSAWTEINKNFLGEMRSVTIGLIKQSVVVVVVHTDRNGRIRIISLRPASRKERSKYYGHR
jgi:uncharacterized DUF497 family protein